MIVIPKSNEDRPDINLRLGIKSSMPNISGLFAALFSFYKIVDESKVSYSKEFSKPNSRTGIELTDNIKTKLLDFYRTQIDNSNLDDETFITNFNKLPLFEKQIEPLQVVLQLFLRICSIDLEVPPNNRERDGKSRFKKVLQFSTNMDTVDAVLTENDDSISLENKNLLFNWINKTELPFNSEFKRKISKLLTTFSESTHFKIRKDSNEIIFQQEGIYFELSNGNNVISTDSKEDVGPFRILNSFIKEGLHYYIDEEIKDGYKLRNEISNDELKNYLIRVNSFLNLNPKTTKIDILDVEEEINVDDVTILNKIYYGAPGTGKSHRADNETKGKEVQKVTFHPDYDYHSFVGGYKPTMVGDKIAYKFVAQIFTKIYVNAWKNFVSEDETKPFYLQIEEINRGNCAEIFGDLFQLLDRKSDGSSKYEVTAEEELYKYLLSNEGFNGEHDGIKEGKLRLPSNLKIIATMNTSDQSLFPMDSAFKRRWDWEYVPIDYDCKKSDFIINLDNGKKFKWLDFLKSVNKEIFDIDNNQDKQIGNWFINANHTDNLISEKTFINKVIFYLWNDVFKDEEKTIFKSSDNKNITYTSFFENGKSNNLVSYILEERLKLTDINKSESTATGEE